MNTVDIAPTAQDAVGTRAVTHASPMLRSAKVVCQSGEYICLVRDVSDEGVLLSFLHDVPTEPRVILALGNGQTYPIQRIWAGQEQGGYRFGGSITVQEFLHERAPFAVRPIRLTIAAPARVIDGSQSHAATLVNLSTHGAKFECDTPLPEGRMISFQIQGMGQQLGQVVWNRSGSQTEAVHGLQFQHPLTLRELAAAALRMQPFGPAPTAANAPISAASAA